MVALPAGVQVGAADAEAVAIRTATVAAIVAARILTFNFPAFPRLTDRSGSRQVSTRTRLCVKPCELEEGGAALDEVLVDLVLDRLAHLLGQLEDERAVLGGLGPEAGRLDRGAELDPPPGRQRHEAQRAEKREGRREWEVGRPY